MFFYCIANYPFVLTIYHVSLEPRPALGLDGMVLSVFGDAINFPIKGYEIRRVNLKQVSRA